MWARFSASFGESRRISTATFIAASTGRFFGFLFIIAGVSQALRGNVGNGLWTHSSLVLESARAQIQQQMVQGLLVGHKVSEVMEMHAPRTRTLHYKCSRSGGSPTRSTVLSRGPGRPHSRTADTARLEEIPRPHGRRPLQPKHDTLRR